MWGESNARRNVISANTRGGGMAERSIADAIWRAFAAGAGDFF